MCLRLPRYLTVYLNSYNQCQNLRSPRMGLHEYQFFVEFDQ
jgi:hypothetical protein